MSITWQSVGATPPQGAGTGPLSVTYPASIAAGDLLVLIVGLHPSTANGGTIGSGGVITGWNAGPANGGSNVGGYSSTNGTDVGNCRIWMFTKVATGTESGNLSVTIGQSSAAWGQIHRLSAGAGSTWDVAGAIGGDTTAGNVSIAFGSNPGITAGDYVLAAFAIPTNLATFTAEALSASGVTFGTVTESGEAAVANNNHAGGFTVRAPVNSGTATGNATLTATTGGTTTNARGPGVILRIREVVPPAGSPSPISPTGSLIWKDFNTTRTFSVTTTTIGNAWLLGQGATTTLTPPTGGNATWFKLAGPNQNTGGSPLVNFEIWLGVHTAIGTQDISINTSTTGSYGAYCLELTCDGVGSDTVWGLDVGDVRDNATNSLNVTFPALATAGPNRAYVGMCIVGSDVATSGQPSGWSIYRDPGPYFNAIGVNGTVGEGTITPVWVQDSSNDSYDVGALIYALVPDKPKGGFFPFFGGPGHHADELGERRMRRHRSGLYVPERRTLVRAA